MSGSPAAAAAGAEGSARAQEDRTAFITGGASGIGFGIACACAEVGMRVVLADRDTGALAASAADLRSRAAVEVSTMSLDVADAEQWQVAARALAAGPGRLHLLFNNAGVTGSGRVAGELGTAEWDRIVAVNLRSAFLGVSAMLPLLRTHGEPAHIVNTASMAALLPYAGGAAYTASKAALLAYSECLVQELAASSVGVSVLLPAQVRTNLFRTSMDGLGRAGAGLTERRGRDACSLETEGLDPQGVGRAVLAAVRAGAFYIITHPELRAAVDVRFERIREAMVGADRAVQPDGGDSLS